MTTSMKAALYPVEDLAAAPTARSVWRAGAIATVVGSGAAAAYGWLLDVTGIRMLVGRPGATEAQEAPIVTFAWGAAMLTIIATILAVILTRHARRPGRTFVITSGVLALISVALPLAAGATASSTKLTFALGHIVLAAIIIPIIAGDLPPARDSKTRNADRLTTTRRPTKG